MRAGVEAKPKLRCMFSWIVSGTRQAGAPSIPGLRIGVPTSLDKKDPNINSEDTPSRSDTPSIRSYSLNVTTDAAHLALRYLLS